MVSIEEGLNMNKICPLSLATNTPFDCLKNRCALWVVDVDNKYFCMYLAKFSTEYLLDRLALGEQQLNEKLNTDIVKKSPTYSYG